MRYLVHHMLRDSALRDPNREALVDRGQRLSFFEMAERTSALASGLQSLGLQRGDRVGIFLPPELSLPLSIMSASQAGGVFVPIHHSLFPDQVAHILKDCSARGLITDAERWNTLQESGALCDTSLAFSIIDTEDGSTGSDNDIPVVRLGSLIDSKGAETPDPRIGNDLAAILYTSGSTGKPKGVMLSHRNLLAGAEIVADYLSITNNDRILAALPFSFDAGLNQLTTAMLTGATTVMIQFRFGRSIVQALINEHITGLAGVPSLWSLLASSSSGIGKQPLEHLRYITNTGGAMPQKILAKLRQHLPGTDIFLMYGLTEAFRSTYLPPSELDTRPTSIGKAIPDTEILVVDENGNRCAPGEVGELVHRGPTVSLGYWGKPELTERVLRPNPIAPPGQTQPGQTQPGQTQPGQTQPELVCYSGDMVQQDEEGFLYFVCRRDNQIKSSGFRISPNEVEEVICRIAPVDQAAVVGIPDDVLGQHLVAFVVPQEGQQSLDPDEVLSRCASAMPRHMIPKRVELTDRLPMTANGKTDYPALREQSIRPQAST